MLDFKQYSADDDDYWMVNKDKNVLVRIGPSSIRQCFGWRMAKSCDFQDIWTLQNIYIKPDCRGRGLFEEYLEDIFSYFAIRNTALILFPTPFEFSCCPFEHGKNARVIENRNIADKERLIEWYKKFGLQTVKTGFYNRRGIIKDLVNTMISGEKERRFAEKGEYFAQMILPENFGYTYLGMNYGCTYPQSLFYQEEFHPDFL